MEPGVHSTGEVIDAPASRGAADWIAPEGGLHVAHIAVEEAPELALGRLTAGTAGAAGVAVARGDARAPSSDHTSAGQDALVRLPIGGPAAVVDAGFDLLRRRFVLLVGMAAVLFVPIQLAELALTVSQGLVSDDIGTGIQLVGSGSDGWGVVFSLLRAVALSLLGIGVGHVVWLGIDGRVPSARSVATLLARRCWVAPCLVVMSLAFKLPASCIFFVGFFLADALVFVSSIAAGAESSGPVGALRRSLSLTRGAYGLALIVSFAGFVISVVLQIALLLGPTALAATFTTADVVLVIVQQIGLLILLVVQPLTAAIAAAAYLELRCRVEGFDLERRQAARGLA